MGMVPSVVVSVCEPVPDFALCSHALCPNTLACELEPFLNLWLGVCLSSYFTFIRLDSF